MGRLYRSFMVFFFASGGYSCAAVGPDYLPPEIQVRAKYSEQVEETDRRSKGAKEGEEPMRIRLWWRELGDRVLERLIEEAVSRGYDLRIAAARVAEARALRGFAQAQLFPRLDATGAVSRNRDSENSRFAFGDTFEPMYTEQFVVLESNWEIDIWGRVRREIEAANAELAATEELLEDTRRSIIARISSEYIALRGAQRELDVTIRNLSTQRQTLKLTESLEASGLGSRADIARTRGLVKETESVIPVLQAQVAGGVHRLAVLTGQDAEKIRQELAVASLLPETPPTLPVGFPAELLRSRPDIRAAERELAAATARIGVAVGDLFPRVSLNGRFGNNSMQVNTLFEPSSRSFGIGPAIRWPMFDFGRVRSGVNAQGARQQATLAHYERTVAQAISEVETALALLRSRLESRDRLKAALESTNESFHLLEARYRAGAISFLDILDTQRRVLALEAALSRIQTQVLLDFVALRNALG